MYSTTGSDALDHRLNTFLHFGSLIDIEAAHVFISHLCNAATQEISIDYLALSYADLLDVGLHAWEAGFDGLDANVMHVVPLSGGLDSRAILGALLKRIPPQSIYTFTYGTRGTWDAACAQHISQYAGTKHTFVNLPDLRITTADLVAFAQQQAMPINIHAYYNHLVYEHFGERVIYWSGHAGGALSGVHTNRTGANLSWNEAAQHFITSNQFAYLKWTHPDFNPKQHLPDTPFAHDTKISYPDQLDMAFRQDQHLKQVLLNPANKVMTPFLSTQWIQYILGVPSALRHQRKLYKDMLLYAYPDLFSLLPTSRNVGLPLHVTGWRRRLHKRWLRFRTKLKQIMPTPLRWPDLDTNYIDLKVAFVRKPWVRDLFYENITDLARRGVIDWVDVLQVWKNFDTMPINLDKDLELLLSVEILFKAGKLTG